MKPKTRIQRLLMITCHLELSLALFIDVGSREINKEKYVERFGSIINHGFVALGIAAGQKLGLVKAFGDFKTPVSSQELADHMHLKERYSENSMVISMEKDVIC